MKYMAAYLLLGLAGNTSPSAEDIKTVLSSVGIDADEERLSTLLKELDGKDINEVCIFFDMRNSHNPAYDMRFCDMPLTFFPADRFRL